MKSRRRSVKLPARYAEAAEVYSPKLRQQKQEQVSTTESKNVPTRKSRKRERDPSPEAAKNETPSPIGKKKKGVPSPESSAEDDSNSKSGRLKERIRGMIDELSEKNGEEYLYLTVNVKDMKGECQGSKVGCDFVKGNYGVVYQFFRFCSEIYQTSMKRNDSHSPSGNNDPSVNSSKTSSRKGEDISIDFREEASEEDIQPEKVITPSASARPKKLVSLLGNLKLLRVAVPSQQTETSCSNVDSVEKPQTVKISENSEKDNNKDDSVENPQREKNSELIEKDTEEEDVKDMSNQKGFECEDCGYVFTERKSYSRHQRLTCPARPRDNQMTEQISDSAKRRTSEAGVDILGKKGYKCEACGRVLPWKKSYYQHRRLHCPLKKLLPSNTTATNQSNQEETDSPSKEGFECERCGLVMKWRKSYYRHCRLYCPGLEKSGASNTSLMGDRANVVCAKPTGEYDASLVKNIKKEKDGDDSRNIDTSEIGESCDLIDEQPEMVKRTIKRKEFGDDFLVDKVLSLESHDIFEEEEYKPTKQDKEAEDEDIQEDALDFNGKDISQYFEGDWSAPSRKKGRFKCKKCGKVLFWKKSCLRHLKSFLCSMRENYDRVQDFTDGVVTIKKDVLETNEGENAVQVQSFVGTVDENVECSGSIMAEENESASKYFEGDMSRSSKEKSIFKCKLCGKLVTWKKSFLQHLRSRSCMESVNSKKQQMDKGEEEEEVDGKLITSYETLSDEAVSQYFDGEMLPGGDFKSLYKCKKCGKCLIWKKSLLRHLRSKTCSELTAARKECDLEFSCKNCQLVFKAEQALKEHQNSNICLGLSSDRGDLPGDAAAENRESSSISQSLAAESESKEENGENQDKDKSEENEMLEEGREESEDIRLMQSRTKSGFKCTICQKKFLNLDQYRRHYHKHANDSRMRQQLRCSICGKVFRKRLQLILHRIRDHKTKEVFPCLRCRHKFRTLKEFRMHLGSKVCSSIYKCKEFNPADEQTACDSTNDTESSVVKCLDCKKNLTSPSMLKPAVGYNCRFCEMKFTRLKDFNRHQSVHLKTKCYSCHICKQSFIQVRYLHSHYIEVHKEKHSICRYCGELFQDRNTLIQHQRDKHKMGSKVSTCQHCNKEFSNKQDYLEHLEVHSVKPYAICEICGKFLSKYSSLKKHMDTHSDVKKYTCEVCNKKFRSFYTFKKHEACHRPNEKPKFQCDECGEFFSANHILKKHKLTHILNPMFHCEECPKKFRSQEGLNYHKLRYHVTKENVSKCKFKVRECPYCGLLISLKGSYELHIAKHTGERPYKCDKCDKAYPIKTMLNRHIMSHYRMYKCEICNVTFSYKSKYKRHHKTQKHIEECQKLGIDSSFPEERFPPKRGNLLELAQKMEEQLKAEQGLTESTLHTEDDIAEDSVQLDQDDHQRALEAIKAVGEIEAGEICEADEGEQKIVESQISEHCYQGNTEHSYHGDVADAVRTVETNLGQQPLDCIILNIPAEHFDNAFNIQFALGANESVQSTS